MAYSAPCHDVLPRFCNRDNSRSPHISTALRPGRCFLRIQPSKLAFDVQYYFFRTLIRGNGGA
jgi:hypothetical protein